MPNAMDELLFPPKRLITIDDMTEVMPSAIQTMVFGNRDNWSLQNDEQKTMTELPEYTLMLNFCMGFYDRNADVTLKCMDIMNRLFSNRNHLCDKWTPTVILINPHLKYNDEIRTLFYPES